MDGCIDGLKDDMKFGMVSESLALQATAVQQRPFPSYDKPE